MRSTHSGLPATNGQRSRQFYETYFDPATAQRYDDGAVIIATPTRSS